jgi:antitoxin ParD1/3/4
MNVRIYVDLSEQQMAFAERKAREGGYASVADVIVELVRDDMLAEYDKPANHDPVMAIKDEILRRMELPDDQWVRMDENDTMFPDLRAHIKEQIENGR